MASRVPPLVVSNLSERVTEYMIRDIFSVAGPIEKVRIVPSTSGSTATALVYYDSLVSAKRALTTLHERSLFSLEMQCSLGSPEDGLDPVTNSSPQLAQTASNTVPSLQPKRLNQTTAHLFVGDLAHEVNDEALEKAFSHYPSLSDSRVMWDMNSGKSRGYGFVAFHSREDAEDAIRTMNGYKLGSRPIRVNWANQKNHHIYADRSSTSAGKERFNNNANGAISGSSRFSESNQELSQQVPLDYMTVLSQSSRMNTTVYVGNLSHKATQDDLMPLFRQFGYVADIRMQSERAFAFVKLDSHENAALAIVHLQGTMVLGRPLRCSWGRDRAGNEPLAPNATSLYARTDGASMPMRNYMENPPLMSSQLPHQPMPNASVLSMPPTLQESFSTGIPQQIPEIPGAAGVPNPMQADVYSQQSGQDVRQLPTFQTLTPTPFFDQMSRQFQPAFGAPPVTNPTSQYQQPFQSFPPNGPPYPMNNYSMPPHYPSN